MGARRKMLHLTEALLGILLLRRWDTENFG